MFFRDGVRRIDFVLSYVDDKDGEKKQVTGRRESEYSEYAKKRSINKYNL